MNNTIWRSERFCRLPVSGACSAMHERVTVAWLALSAALCTACGDPLVAPELIVDNRVLGARAQSVDDSERAWLAPAERGLVRWLVVAPEAAPALGWASSLCVAQTVSRGLPRCAAKSFARFTRDVEANEEPQFEFSMPGQEAFGSARQVAIFNAFCSSGAPVMDELGVDPTTTRCPDLGERPLFATLELSLSDGSSQNLHPSFAGSSFGFDQRNWPTIDAPANGSSVVSGACSADDPTLPSVRAGSAAHQLQLDLPSGSSEALEMRSPHSPPRETLQLAHFTTAGDLERAYSTLDSAGASKLSLTWTPPGEVPAEGQLVRFYFVLRDGRGGSDWTRRAVCVLP